MAELDSFGSLLNSMGYGGSTSSASTGAKKSMPTSSTPPGTSSVSGSSSARTKPAGSSYLANYEGEVVVEVPGQQGWPPSDTDGLSRIAKLLCIASVGKKINLENVLDLHRLVVWARYKILVETQLSDEGLTCLDILLLFFLFFQPTLI